MLRVLPTTVKRVLQQTEVVTSCVNTVVWMDEIMRKSRRTGELRHLLQKKSLPWVGETRNMYRFWCKKECSLLSAITDLL